MRLLRINSDRSMHFEEFEGDAVPPYAILSHTWSAEGEMTYQDLEDASTRVLNSVRKTRVKKLSREVPGFAKILGCAKTTRDEGLEYCWIDTCCIDKRSSSELTEAINSMYKWYQNATVCYAYLSDVPTKPWQESRWFTRCWTLQELLAPGKVVFYDKTWKVIGSKEQWLDELARITNIQKAALQGWSLRHFTVATKMWWAAKRNSTRTEDMAYCLLGIFDIHMPLLYGEGIKAFQRLQEAILARTHDESMFVWTAKSNMNLPFYHGLLAPSPACFHGDFQIRLRQYNTDVATVSSKGLELKVTLIPDDREPSLYRATLNCSSSTGQQPAIYLMLTESRNVHAGTRADMSDLENEAFVRVKTDQIVYVTSNPMPSRAPMKINIVVPNLSKEPSYIPAPELDLIIVILEGNRPYVEFTESIGPIRIFSNDFAMAKARPGSVASLLFRQTHTVILGLKDSGSPWCQILPLGDAKALTAAGEAEATAAWKSYEETSYNDRRAKSRVGGVEARVSIIYNGNFLELAVSISEVGSREPVPGVLPRR